MRFMLAALSLAFGGCDATTDAETDETLGRLLVEEQASPTVVRE